jgi:uncharacterized membrane protein
VRLNMANDDSTGAGTVIKWHAPDTDLLLVLAYAIVTAATALAPIAELAPIASVLGLGLALFVAGYALVAALFPVKGAIGGLERAALSNGMSLMAAALAGTVLYFSPFGFSPGLLSACLAAFTVACALVAVKRRPATRHEGRSRLMPEIWPADRLNLALIVVLMLCILASVSFLSCAVLVPQPGKAFTEFYLLGPDGKAGNYPVRLHLGDTAPVIVGIANHEHRDMAYDLVVLLNDSVNVTRLYEENVSVVKDQTWEKKIELKPDATGKNLKFEVLLYTDGNYTAPYRNLRLIVNVTQPFL